MTTTDKAQLTLDEIRKTHDTTAMNAETFASMAQAVAFYIKGGHSAKEAAQLVIDEYWPLVS